MSTILQRVNSRNTVNKEYKCVVQLLVDSQNISVDFKKDDTGRVILDYVCEMLNLVEKDYFSLRYTDANRHRYWIDLAKPILRQVKTTSPVIFAFRARYYPVDPFVLREQLTRYLLTLQLQRDLLHGRLYCPQNDAAVLGAYIVQADLGDYNPQEHKGNYVSQFKLFLNQTPRLEEKVAIEHQKLSGKEITQTDADLEFLKKTCMLDTYGYYPYTVKDLKNWQVYIGSTPKGLLIYQAHRKLHQLAWKDITGFDYTGKEFVINVSERYSNEHDIGEEGDQQVPVEDENDKTDKPNHPNDANSTFNKNNNKNKNKPQLRFVCPSAVFCKQLWKYMLGQQAFYTKQKGEEVKPVVVRRGPLFKRATFRFSGRVLQEIAGSASPKRAEPAFERIHLQRQPPREERNALWANKFHTLPRTMKAVPEERTADDTNQSTPIVTPSQNKNLSLDTTAELTPILTPTSGLSPLIENGPWMTSGMETSSNCRMDQFSSKSTSPSGSSHVYQSEVITVRLKRVEPASPTQKQHDANNNGCIVSGQGSTPISHNKDETSLNKSAHSNDQTMQHSQLQRSRSGAVAKNILTVLMFLILLMIAVVMVMEVQDNQFRQYVSRVTGDDTFRRTVYNPVRQRVLESYQRVFN